jgi:hypothetical protein
MGAGVNDLEALTTARQLCALSDHDLAKVTQLTKKTLERLLERDLNVGDLLVKIDGLGQAIKRGGGSGLLSADMNSALEQLFLTGALVAKNTRPKGGPGETV